MSDIAPDTLQDSNDLSYLNDDELIRGIEMLFYAYRDFTSDPDEILTKYGFGRAHHRVVHFVGRNPGMTVAELLAILKVTKQSLSRVLSQLVSEAFVVQEKGVRDRRQRLLYLSPKGETLFEELSRPQKDRVARAYRAAGAEAVAGYRKVLEDLLNAEERAAVLQAVERS
ncbi:MAG: MarR family transcriptional regulator [Rhodospirillaceae bacterium]|jgi:DNA-binding MarR family transcriptional regulator|nr:MarR family transcriptional regulator [Rhodospirillaceae bacterium]MBT4045816.1 MarR family transcriptional regulator [Rhodospirillaceae bacterium]MBT4690113.1 MarR family transcriptional regulator [Rhodospirillaceae bacterium]MBT5080678.1 MarR family transcriptional regulator [Rhodospirillaceae bacterium]MBT5524206.1 MarR family transcriptional regulator [Rhodospirillaceae bacterium]